MNVFKTKDFQLLFKEWNNKLLESGLQDVEETFSGQRRLKEQGNIFHSVDPLIFECKQEYYLRLTEGVTNSHFQNESEKTILTLFSDGYSITDISDYLKENNLPKSNHRTITLIIRRYEHKWGIKTHPDNKLYPYKGKYKHGKSDI